MTESTITIQLPASTSNCGPGFDTLGIALSLYNFVRVEFRGQGEPITAAETVHSTREAADMATEVRNAFCLATALPAHGFHFDIWGEIPAARGLGSSATLRAGILMALNEFHGRPLSVSGMIGLIAALDLAPDNATAVFAGGFVVARSHPQTAAFVDHIKFSVDEALSFIAIAPDIEVKTRDARALLPKNYPFVDAARSINSASYTVAAFASREYEKLGEAVSDFMHQPYRLRLCPFVEESIAAGVASGAYTGWLSGSGSSVICVAPKENALEVAKSMGEVYQFNAIPFRAFQLRVDNNGAKVI